MKIHTKVLSVFLSGLMVIAMPLKTAVNAGTTKGDDFMKSNIGRITTGERIDDKVYNIVIDYSMGNITFKCSSNETPEQYFEFQYKSRDKSVVDNSCEIKYGDINNSELGWTLDTTGSLDTNFNPAKTDNCNFKVSSSKTDFASDSEANACLEKAAVTSMKAINQTLINNMDISLGDLGFTNFKKAGIEIPVVNNPLSGKYFDNSLLDVGNDGYLYKDQVFDIEGIEYEVSARGQSILYSFAVTFPDGAIVTANLPTKESNFNPWMIFYFPGLDINKGEVAMCLADIPQDYDLDTDLYFLMTTSTVLTYSYRSDMSTVANDYTRIAMQVLDYAFREAGYDLTSIGFIDFYGPHEEPGVEGFVERLYTVAMNRESDEKGKAYWVNEVKVNGKTGADLGLSFLLSDEFLGKNMSNSQFLDVLYATFFNREAEDAGKKYWTDEMTSGRKSKTDVIYGFINSEEWANICVSYGIKSGTDVKPTIEVTPNDKINGFAERLYTTCLKRDSDQGGLDFWAKELANLRRTGSEAAKGFFFSDEINKSGITDSEFLTRLYRTLMDREPESDGFNYWLGQMKSGAMSRSDVFDGFASSEEWIGICADYGILR